MRFRSKVDWWLGAIVMVVPLASLVLVAFEASAQGGWWLIPVLLGVYFLVSLICWPCEYVLEESHVLVRSGVIKWRVPYEQIDRVHPTRNPLSSPAWSLDRLAIVYGKKWVMVSPKDRVGFLTELMRRTGLRQRGEDLVRGA